MRLAANLFLLSILVSNSIGRAAHADAISEAIGAKRGIVAIVGSPDKEILDLRCLETNELQFFFHVETVDQALALQSTAASHAVLGTRVFVSHGSLDSIALGNNVADGVIVSKAAEGKTNNRELLRILRPRGKALVAGKELTKPVPDGIDEWSHPYHGPDNNPQSNDKLVRGDLQTQFIAYPKFSPMPEQTVIAGGRIYKAMGHIAHKANQNKWLNTLICVNAYNGTILWQRKTSPGFMIHRNTMVATENALYMGDHESCKKFDAETGELVDEIKVSKDISDGPVWKWMAIRDGVLYALVGNPEVKVETLRSARRGLGHWPWGMWEGHDYNDPRTAFGYGRTIVAIDLETKKQLWHYRDEEFLDARAVCMNSKDLHVYCPEKFLAAIDISNGELRWKNFDKDVLEAIGPNGKAQHYITGYATTCYMKCNEDYLFFAGPQRSALVTASAADGGLEWTYPSGNLQLVIRDKGIWAAGPQKGKSGMQFDFAGKIVAEFPARRACTRATGCADSIFYRANGGTVRVFTDSNESQHIDPMRPPCQDGVLISNGHLYWGPWMCGCQLSLYGNICLSALGEKRQPIANPYETALRVMDDRVKLQRLDIHQDDWVTYRGNNARSNVSNAQIADEYKPTWTKKLASNELPTAPVTAGGHVFVADRTGAVRAFTNSGDPVWNTFVSGPVYYPPVIANDRLLVGSADGYVYAMEAATGKMLWSFRVAPEDARIPVYEKLISRWPVSGGVVVANDTVYAAAGISHYDGTYVVALDVKTGELKAMNNRSGIVSDEVNNGMSLQGNLSIVDGELRFLAGGVYEIARYDLETLAVLNQPKNQVFSEFRTAFYPFYPEYGKYLSIDHTFADGKTLVHDASYEGNQFTDLAMHDALPPGVERPRKEAARWIRRRGGTPPKILWKDNQKLRFNSFVLNDSRMLAAAHPEGNEKDAFLISIDLPSGRELSRQPMSALAVKGGLAVDHRGQVFVSTENGELTAFAPSN